MKHTITTIFMMASLCAGCADLPPAEEDMQNNPLVIEVEDPIVFNVSDDGKPIPSPSTRSLVCQDDDARICNLSVWSYGSDGYLAHTCYLREDELSNVSHTSILGENASGKTFTVLLLANAGDRTGEAPSTLQEAREVTFDLSTIPDRSVFPLCGLHGEVTTRTVGLKVHRLVTRYDFSFRSSPGNPNEYYIKSFKIMNMNSSIRPFLPQYRATATEEGPSEGFSRSDIASVGAGGSASVYVYENCQGTINPSVITSPELKRESNLDSASRRLCTYLEFTGGVVENTVSGTAVNSRYLPEVKYRWYFGKGENMYTSNFDVPGNCIYNITINFESFSVKRKEWIVEPGHELVLVPDFQKMLMSNGMVPLTASLFMDGECVEPEYPCVWSITSGTDKVEVGGGAVSGYLCGKSVGQATVQCEGEYEGVKIRSSSKVSVLNGKWLCQYATGSGFRSSGYGSIDITKSALKFSAVDGYRLMSVEGLIRQDGYDQYEDSWFYVTSPSASWTNPMYSLLPSTLIYLDECPTAEVVRRYIPGEAQYPELQMFRIFYADKDDNLYEEYVTWDNLLKINDASGLLE